MKHLTTTLLLLAIVALAAWFPQDDYAMRYAKWKKMYAIEQVKTLKDGTLLVRLHTRNKAIDLYRSNGQHEIANRIEDEQYQDNKAIVAAFNEHFNFAKVYFFFADDTDKIKARQEGVVFINHLMKADPSIAPNLDAYMVAEFGPLEGETRVIPGDTLVPLPDHVQGETLERALVVRDANFMQMRSPFPYYVRAANRGKPERQVARLNNLLHTYYVNATK